MSDGTASTLRVIECGVRLMCHFRTFPLFFDTQADTLPRRQGQKHPENEVFLSTPFVVFVFFTNHHSAFDAEAPRPPTN